MGLPLVVKAHEYKFRLELSEAGRRGGAAGNEKHINVLSVRLKFKLGSECSFWGFNLDSISSHLAQIKMKGVIFFYSIYILRVGPTSTTA